MFALLAVVRRGLLGGDAGCSVALVRSVQTSLQKLQGLAENSGSQEADALEIQTKEDFSFFSPVPGKGSMPSWAGTKYDEIPIIHIKATYNNTHIHVVTHQNASLTLVTCGTEGFKNAKKGTAIAAQTAGISAAVKARAKGLSHVRVVVKGLGPGRLGVGSSINAAGGTGPKFTRDVGSRILWQLHHQQFLLTHQTLIHRHGSMKWQSPKTAGWTVPFEIATSSSSR